jgi:hypothetical protein
MATDTNCRESFKAGTSTFVDRLKKLVHEGNVRRVIVEQDGKTIAEFPLTAGVVGVVLAPVVAAVGALVALLKDCTIHIDRTESAVAVTAATKDDKVA